MGAAAAPSCPRHVVIEVSGDEAGSDAEAAQRLHHQHREIATRAGTERDRLRGGLRAFLVPGLIAEFGFYGVRHRFHDRERARLACAADNPARPCVDRSLRVRGSRLRKTGEVGRLFLRVGEREGLR